MTCQKQSQHKRLESWCTEIPHDPNIFHQFILHELILGEQGWEHEARRGKKKKKERERRHNQDCRDSILILLDRKVQRVCSLVRSTLTLNWLSGLFWMNRLTPFSYQDPKETHATNVFSVNLILLGFLPLTFFTSFITHHRHSTSIFAAIHGHHCGQERPVVLLWICAKMLELQHGRHFRTTIWTESSWPTGWNRRLH